MFKKLKPKDIAVLILTITLSIILVISTVSVYEGKDPDGRIEELIAFILGSITTIVGEYILLHLKTGKKDDEDE
jgi:high-affinity K+ transport system ATPase subunit B